MTRSMLLWSTAAIALATGAVPGSARAQSHPAPAPAPAPAQTHPQAPPPDEMDDEGSEDIVVTGELRGAVPGDIPPEIQYSQADVRAMGVSSISDLIDELAPQLGSGQGRGGERPVILLAGRRISSFAEIRDIPTEAIERVDILPEEVALKYGYSANQKVVNIVLRQRFRALTTELEGRTPTAGGMAGGKGSADILKIARDKRINLDVQYNGASGLLESERNVIRDAGGTGMGQVIGPVTDLTPYRTLVSPSQHLTVNGVYSRNLNSKLSASANLQLDVSQSQGLLGLPSATLTLPAGNPYSPFPADTLATRYFDGQLPISRDNKSQALHGGFTLNGDGLPWGRDWRWSLTGNYDRTTTQNLTDGNVDPAMLQALLDANDPGFDPYGSVRRDLLTFRPGDRANSTASTGELNALFTGPLFKVPAGDVRTSVRLNGSTSDFDSDSLRQGIARSGGSARDSGSAKLNVDLPIASRRRAVLDAIGDLSFNGNVEVEQLSDFGQLVTTGYGVNWSPIPQVRFIGSVTDEEGAPSANQLGDPVLSTPNVRVFDYVRGESVDITSISGGNPLLSADHRHVMKLGVNIRPFDKKDFNLSADYVTSTTRDQISAFPAPTAAVEAAFPDRFVRDNAGRLLSVDNRPVNFDRAERAQLRWGFNLSVPVSSSLEKKIAAARAERQRQRAEAEKNGTPLPPEAMGRWRRDQQQGQGQPGQPGQGQPQRPFGGGSLFGNDGGGGGRGPGGGGGGGGRGGGRGGFGGANSPLAGRLQFSLYHTWHFKEQVTIRPGLPVIDLLDGGATGSRGGQPEHELEGQAGFTKDGFGLRLIGNWKSGTTVFGGLTGADKLDFGSQTAINLRLFADLGRQLKLVRDHHWLRGARVTFSVDNLFDQHQRVTDANGEVPLSYQPDLLDPQGRTVRLSFRKLFL